MSTAVAEAAVLPAFNDDPTAGAAVLPRQRGGLRSVPTCASPDDSPDDPLRLGRPMRLRLRAAVQALLADESLAELKDAPRLAAVVLYAKSRAPQGRRDDNQTSIWGAELGRWLGMRESTVHHKVLPVLRASGALRTRQVRDGEGHPTGLDCLVMPLWKARKNGGVTHPLALSKVELATLLRLLEALFGPGWTPEDKEPTPPGELASRTGKGAATDRLGLLLMVLNTRASGWLQLCGGSVNKREGRGAATVARLMGCSPSGARKVLARLSETGVVARGRKETSTRMNGKGRVMLLPVARAYGRLPAVLDAVQEAVQEGGAVFSARPDGACGDQGPAETASGLEPSGIEAAEPVVQEAGRERPDGAEFHALHASGVSVGGVCAGCGGFSGDAPLGDSPRPECVCAREDRPVDTGRPGGQLTLVDGLGGPLRGEQPKSSDPTTGDHDQDPAEVGGDGTPGQDAAGRVLDLFTAGHRRQRGRVPRPPVDLETVVARAGALWACLDREGARRRVVDAVRRELAAVAGVTGSGAAGEVLAGRLRRRLAEQGGPGRVKDPVGWLLGKGLPRRPGCGDYRCDDGAWMDTGATCPACEGRITDRRAVRHQVAAAVDAELPGAPADQARAETERRLQHETALEAERQQVVRERAAAERAARQAATDQARAQAAEQERVRQAVVCADCGAPGSAGLCGMCGDRRQIAERLRQVGVDAAAASGVHVADRGAVQAVVAAAEAKVREEMAAAVEHHRDLGVCEPALLVAAERMVAEAACDAYREEGRRRIGGGGEVQAELRRVYAMELRKRPAGEPRDEAEQAADHAAQVAAYKASHKLFQERVDAVEQLLTQRAAVPAPRAARSWAQRMAEMALRPLADEVAGHRT